jgi:recombinational DNA repair protein (RecF pathway)
VGALHNVDAAAKALGTQWFAADHEARLACGQLVIEAIQKLIPNYDLSRNLYSQFFFFANHQSATDLEEGAKWFSETAVTAKDESRPYLLP